MKYLVFSDIHGSLEAAQFIQKKFLEGKVDKILCLGDFLYHGPRNDLPEDYNPKEVFGILNLMKDHILAVRGNCDSEVDQMVLEFPMMSDNYEFMLGDKKVCLTHGHLNIPDKKFDVILSGHTHIPVAEREEGVVYCNPGSISIPKGGYDKSYGVLSEDEFIVLTMDEEILMQIEI
ncbi:phosphodiesterase [Anaerorhabdus furcosa]|uniref:Phosphoesterase n=1 Tax=Anaerorhabdus furcosa TaxID=118967 RepID=A0A1T4K0W6_9FIRM|nr:phosphodiesterase [Anaerorhabdus furcosa]SJZ36126.1 hypothetical protein SAMN02745191_0231 [Anaerorhabdus furcosa]